MSLQDGIHGRVGGRRRSARRRRRAPRPSPGSRRRGRGIAERRRPRARQHDRLAARDREYGGIHLVELGRRAERLEQLVGREMAATRRERERPAAHVLERPGPVDVGAGVEDQLDEPHASPARDRVVQAAAFVHVGAAVEEETKTLEVLEVDLVADVVLGTRRRCSRSGGRGAARRTSYSRPGPRLGRKARRRDDPDGYPVGLPARGRPRRARRSRVATPRGRPVCRRPHAAPRGRARR